MGRFVYVVWSYGESEGGVTVSVLCAFESEREAAEYAARVVGSRVAYVPFMPGACPAVGLDAEEGV